MGLASVVFPNQASSLGIGWGLALAPWGLVFIGVAESEDRRTEPSASNATRSMPVNRLGP